MARTDTLGHFLTDVADAIREKKGSVDAIAAEDFDTEIENLPSGGGSYAPEFISFHNCPDALLQDAIDDEAIDYSNVTNLSGCCSKYNGWTSTLQTIDITPITDAKNVTSLSGMLAYRNGLKTIIGLDKLDTSKVTDFTQIFYYCPSITSLDLSTWDTSSATSMASMFASAFTSNSTKISLDLSNFDTSNVTNFSYMFNLSKIGSLDLSGWTAKSSGGINAGGMFSTTHIEHIDMRAFDFTKISSYSTMFGYNANNGLPASCEFIVADQTQKDWVLSKANWLTNVKTVAEYEAEQNQ